MLSAVGPSPSEMAAAHVVPNQFIVTLKPGVDVQAFANEIRGSGRAVSHTYSHALNGLAFRGAAIGDDPRIAAIEPDLILRTAAQTLPTGVNRIDADGNPTARIDGNDERVDVDMAIIDTGVNLDHPDLNVHNQKNFASNCTWFLGIPLSCQPPNPTANDGNGHGTHVAGTAAAIDNASHVVGVAPVARIWAVKVLDDEGFGFTSEIIAGIDYVTANAGQIEVANMSLGGQGQSSAMRTAIQNSVNTGVFYAVAAGNSAQDVYGGDGAFDTSDDFIPAAYPEVAAVSALADFDGQAGGAGTGSFAFSICTESHDDTLACFSNFSRSVVAGNPVASPGAAIDVAAPGVGVLSTWNDGGTNTISGTSMASPHVAGVAALYIAQHGRANDAASVYAIRQALIDAGQPQTAWRSDNQTQDPDGNRERLAMAMFGPVDAPPTVTITDPDEGATVSGTVTVTADASDDDGVSQVEFFVDGVSIGVDSDGDGGWSVEWNSASVGDGPHTVTATAIDTIGQSSSDSVGVIVDNVDDPPSVAIASPPAGAYVSGAITTTADASDDKGVTQVEFFVDGRSIGVDNDGGDGWSVSWDTTSESDGNYTLTATARDTAGQTASDSLSVTVDNTAPSSVSITDPADGAAVSGTITIAAEANDATSGVAQVEFFVDGASIGVDTDGSNGWSISWNTTAVNNGAHNLTAQARDKAGNAATSAAVEVTVDNPTDAIHVGDLDASKDIKGKSGKWEAFVTVSIHNASEGPVAEATVIGSWSGARSGTVSGVTGAGGTVTFATGNITGDSVTFTVVDVTHAFAYVSEDNHDPDGDSSGTAIFVPKVGEPSPPSASSGGSAPIYLASANERSASSPASLDALQADGSGFAVSPLSGDHQGAARRQGKAASLTADGEVGAQNGGALSSLDEDLDDSLSAEAVDRVFADLAREE